MGRTTHRMTGTPEHRAYWNMVGRCEDPTVDRFPVYGGRGISVCARWRANFADFLADMGLRPSPLHSIDRIDVNGNYEPGNVRWALIRDQARNKRNNVQVTVDGVTMTAADWAAFLEFAGRAFSRVQ